MPLQNRECAPCRGCRNRRNFRDGCATEDDPASPGTCKRCRGQCRRGQVQIAGCTANSDRVCIANCEAGEYFTFDELEGGGCMPCSVNGGPAPPNSFWVEPMEPLLSDDCPWECEASYAKQGDQCVLFQCHPGYYMNDVNLCRRCREAAKPDHAVWILATPEPARDPGACPWACDAAEGYMLGGDGVACVRDLQCEAGTYLGDEGCVTCDNTELPEHAEWVAPPVSRETDPG
eukprot:3940791-Rhodomonas_salina.1